MTVLSIIPGIGAALVWVPAAIILMATGEEMPRRPDPHCWRSLG
jgi:predicted PurR-regulated permease PerM